MRGGTHISDPSCDFFQKGPDPTLIGLENARSDKAGAIAPLDVSNR